MAGANEDTHDEDGLARNVAMTKGQVEQIDAVLRTMSRTLWRTVAACVAMVAAMPVLLVLIDAYFPWQHVHHGIEEKLFAVALMACVVVALLASLGLKALGPREEALVAKARLTKAIADAETA